MYLALHWTAGRRPTVPAGFIHLPSLPTQRVGGRPVERGMELERQVEAVRLVLAAVADEMSRAGDDDPIA